MGSRRGWPQRGAGLRVRSERRAAQRHRDVPELQSARSGRLEDGQSAASAAVRPLLRFLTVGFLAPVFRDALGLTWTEVEQRRFERLFFLVAFVNRFIPPFLYQGGSHVLLAGCPSAGSSDANRCCSRRVKMRGGSWSRYDVFCSAG
ncbi:oxygenase MpaB family protein [Mycobacterium tilburgii]|uniref:oxygenase MpaB family protein n=1 Tax=Mycobacterium tilburgii TaxID=44467 RepID=UPI00389967C8